MATLNPPYGGGDIRGRASFEEMDNYGQRFLLAGAEPRIEGAIAPIKQKASTTLAQYAVVGTDANGDIAMATADGTVKAAFVLPHGSTAGASGDVFPQLWYSGCFNTDDNSPLVWDASFDTQAKKNAAFRGAPTPTTIVARSRQG